MTWQIYRIVGSHMARLFPYFAFKRLRRPEKQTGSHEKYPIFANQQLSYLCYKENHFTIYEIHVTDVCVKKC